MDGATPAIERADGAAPAAKIAVVIPCFNDGATLVEAVRSAQAQDRLDELVAVDDGSTDPDTLATFARLAGEGVRVVRRDNGGLAMARMTGVDATAADYVLCLDADDRLVAGTLGALGAALDADPGLALVWGDYRLFGDFTWVQRTAPTLDPWQVSYQNDAPAAMMIRRSSLLAAGGWQQPVAGYEDWDLLMSLAERGARGARVDIIAYEYRQHGVRMREQAAARHGEKYALLRERHPRLFATRRRAWRRSDAPLALRLALPAIFALPVGADRRRQLGGAATHLARRRGVGLLVRRVRSGV